jgi:hypothetical protein
MDVGDGQHLLADPAVVIQGDRVLHPTYRCVEAAPGRVP